MTETAYTPGPWEYRPKELDDWGMVRGGQTPWGLGPICQARDPRFLDEEYLAECRSTGRDPWEANARLIAAAPELLEALDALLRRFTDLVNCGDCGNWDPEHEFEVIASRAAIAKATGGAA